MTNWAQIHEFYKRYHKIEKMFIFQARVFKFSDLLGEEKLAKFQHNISKFVPFGKKNHRGMGCECHYNNF